MYNGLDKPLFGEARPRVGKIIGLKRFNLSYSLGWSSRYLSYNHELFIIVNGKQSDYQRFEQFFNTKPRTFNFCFSSKIQLIVDRWSKLLRVINFATFHMIYWLFCQISCKYHFPKKLNKLKVNEFFFKFCFFYFWQFSIFFDRIATLIMSSEQSRSY